MGFLPASTIQELQCEVAAFVRRGFSVDDACELAGLPRRRYRPIHVAQPIKWIPTPSEITERCEAIKNGDVELSATSATRWKDWRAAKLLGELEAERRASMNDAYSLAGSIAEDACELPSWFGG